MKRLITSPASVQRPRIPLMATAASPLCFNGGHYKVMITWEGTTVRHGTRLLLPLNIINWPDDDEKKKRKGEYLAFKVLP